MYVGMYVIHLMDGQVREGGNSYLLPILHTTYVAPILRAHESLYGQEGSVSCHSKNKKKRSLTVHPVICVAAAPAAGGSCCMQVIVVPRKVTKTAYCLSLSPPRSLLLHPPLPFL